MSLTSSVVLDGGPHHGEMLLAGPGDVYQDGRLISVGDDGLYVVDAARGVAYWCEGGAEETVRMIEQGTFVARFLLRLGCGHARPMGTAAERGDSITCLSCERVVGIMRCDPIPPTEYPAPDHVRILLERIEDEGLPGA